MNVTGIEWTATHRADGTTTPGFSANPLKFRDKRTGKVVWACVKKSPGCAHCYAEQLAERYHRGGPFTKAEMEHLEPFLDEAELRKMLTAKTVGGVAVAGSRCFVGDMTDVFGEWVPDTLLDRLFAVFALRRDVTWQVLTKRADRMAAYMNRLAKSIDPLQVAARGMGWTLKWDAPNGTTYSLLPWPIPSVWLGVSVENQAAADERIPHLLRTPAAVRFLSVEPLLGPVNLSVFAADGDGPGRGTLYWIGQGAGIDWCIVGGESGPGARPMHPAWVRSLRDQCVAAGVPFFFKQWGEWAPLPKPFYYTPAFGSGNAEYVRALSLYTKAHGCTRLLDDRPEGWGTVMVRDGGCITDGGLAIGDVGKKAAGRLLDGREWNEFPAGTPEAAR